jgi:hypothetical protein
VGAWVKEAATALRNLSVNDENQVAIMAIGGAEAMLRALRAHPSQARLQRRTFGHCII